jgi:UDP-glucose 4-epimerase
MRVLLTGSTGFLGAHLAQKLSEDPRVELFFAVRTCGTKEENTVFPVGNISSKTLWQSALDGKDIVIHCAAITSSGDDGDESALMETNVAGTLKLARDACDADVKRFIYISSIKVNGESTSGSLPFNEQDKPAPQDPYGVSKYEAEEALKKIASETSMDFVNIRAPLVYGPGVKENFRNLMKLSNTKLPLPFGVINNTRSMIYVGNLVDFIITCIDHPAAANETFLVSDQRDLSLRNLLVLIRSSMKRSKNIFPIPLFIFRLVGSLFRKKDVVDRLVGDLQVDTNKASELLDWQPPYTVEQGIKATVDDFLNKASR